MMFDVIFVGVLRADRLAEIRRREWMRKRNFTSVAVWLVEFSNRKSPLRVRSIFDAETLVELFEKNRSFSDESELVPRWWRYRR